MLRGVVGVDADVLVSQIGGPEFAGTAALMEADADGELGLLDVGVRGGLVKIGRAATVPADGEFSKGNVDGLWIDLRAGVSDGCHEAPPVGIAAGPCGFYEWRVGNGLGDPQSLGV